jgi:hypothetical protein
MYEYRVLYRAKNRPRGLWDVWHIFSDLDRLADYIAEFDTDYYSWKIERRELTPWAPVSKSLLKN